MPSERRLTSERDALEKLTAERYVDNRVYTDSEVFELEVERIFQRVWNFVAHESQLPEPGDYITTELCNMPIIVNRDREGKLHAFYNTCRHRGSKVVWDEEGHASAFRCPYHFWVYSLTGELVGIPGEQAYEGTGFEKENFPLVEVACDSVLGLIFVNLDDDPMPLREWLGEEIIEWLSKPLANAEFKVFSKKSFGDSLNWKIFAENARDGYHVPFVHPFFRKASPPGRYHLYRHSHAVQELGMDPNGIDPELWEKIRQHPFPGVEVGEGYIANIFPELAVTLRSNVVSIDWQKIVGPEEIVMQNLTLGLVDDTDDVLEIRKLSQETWFSNPVEMEDWPIFLAQQAGVRSKGVRYSVIARGEDAMEGTRGDDNRLRHFWVEWRRLMGVEANSIEPVT